MHRRFGRSFLIIKNKCTIQEYSSHETIQESRETVQEHSSHETIQESRETIQEYSPGETIHCGDIILTSSEPLANIGVMVA